MVRNLHINAIYFCQMFSDGKREDHTRWTKMNELLDTKRQGKRRCCFELKMKDEEIKTH
jgi:hypothetical protein